eukprot:8852875-Lingulodinium_polyedra.AAC.1
MIVKVSEEVMVSNLTPGQLHGVIGARFLNKWKRNIVESRLIAQGSIQLVDKEGVHASTPLLIVLKSCYEWDPRRI